MEDTIASYMRRRTHRAYAEPSAGKMLMRLQLVTLLVAAAPCMCSAARKIDPAFATNITIYHVNPACEQPPPATL